MKAVIVAGPYGSGKTETIRGLIRGAGNEGRIGAFVAESASIALDQSRYEIGDSAIGVSFASVCCPTLADMRQAMDTALRDKHFDLLFLEPPGNMHPPLMAQIAVEKGFDLEHIIMLVSQRDFPDDRHRTMLHTGLEIASVVGITHSQQPIDDAIIETIKGKNPHAPILTFSRSGLQYGLVQAQPRWSLGRLANITDSDEHEGHHSDHYQKMLRVFNPELSYERILSLLEGIAKTGLVERGKGIIPSYNKQIDIKRTHLEMSTPEKPLSKQSMGYLICFGSGDLPLDVIDRVSMAPDQMTRETFANAPLENKISIFGRLYQASVDRTREVFSGGKVTYTYSPVDEAEKVAMEIYQDSGDNSAIKMILQVYHATRLNALQELSATVPDASTAFAGVHISAVLINKSLSQGQGALDYPKLVDQHQLLDIKEKAISAIFLYASILDSNAIREFPRYKSAVGPYILKAAETGWGSLDDKQKNALERLKSRAKENMAKIHNESNFPGLAESWENLA